MCEAAPLLQPMVSHTLPAPSVDIDQAARLEALRAMVAAAADCDPQSVPGVARMTSSSCVMCFGFPSAQEQTTCSCWKQKVARCDSRQLKSALRRERRDAPQLGRSVSFAACPSMRLVERLSYIDVVGDVHDMSNPNYCAMGISRALRMAQFAEGLTEQVAIECFARWTQAVREAKKARGAGSVLPLLGDAHTLLQLA